MGAMLFSQQTQIAQNRSVSGRFYVSADGACRDAVPGLPSHLGGIQPGRQVALDHDLTVDEHEPGAYLCVAIQVYDSQGSMVMIENPKPTKIFRVVDLRNKNDHKVEFLGWGD